jgi:phosphatidylserine/phosphatidylglycerophosphate/cardiolipin synthase-like enzyme
MPFLVPPPDFTVRQLEEQGLTGTCEIQVTRSCGPWSMGTTDRVEHSIQNAYLKAIQLSEHFVYIENQFFITSTVVDGVEIENQIGDALVNRIIKAHEEGTAWRACIVIPLFPGYTYPIDSDQAASVRLIVECQNKSICRGPNSIFSRLRQEGIDPDDYISFFSLRGWGKFKSGVLTTEMVYIHGKTCIVDDRLVIIGSANINERSMRGDRDSELASIIRDTDMIDSTMAGKPYKVGRFAHTLRVRLMRGASPLVPWYAFACRCLLNPLFQPRLQSTSASTLTQWRTRTYSPATRSHARTKSRRGTRRKSRVPRATASFSTGPSPTGSRCMPARFSRVSSTARRRRSTGRRARLSTSSPARRTR